MLDNPDAVGGHELACILRENHHAGIPSFVTFSQDSGGTWSQPQMCPFALDRPYAKQLPDGRVLVTGRHVNGPLGTYGWCGDLKAEAGSYQIGGPRRKYAAQLVDDALVIDNLPGHEARYCLLPPESARSEVRMEAKLKVEGRPGQAAAFMSISQVGVALQIAVDGVWTFQGSDFRKAIDMSDYHTVTLHHRRGLLRVEVDGETVINQSVFREDKPIGDSRRAGALNQYTHFGQPQTGGRSYWRQVSYSIQNPNLDDFSWWWQADGGEYPDEYQRRRMIQIHGNHPDQPPGPATGSGPRVLVLVDVGRRAYHVGGLHQLRRSGRLQSSGGRLHRAGRHRLKVLSEEREGQEATPVGSASKGFALHLGS